LGSGLGETIGGNETREGNMMEILEQVDLFNAQGTEAICLDPLRAFVILVNEILPYLARKSWRYPGLAEKDHVGVRPVEWFHLGIWERYRRGGIKTD
jgi:hypothetical protein